MAVDWLKLVVLLLTVRLGFGADSEICYYGNAAVPKTLYSHLAGWSCFEHVEYNGKYSKMYACMSDDGFKVPCLRNGNTYLDFSSENGRQKLLNISIEKETLSKCFNEKTTCRLNPTSDSITRVWIPASVCDTEPRNKFHIAMLSISFIVGVVASSFLIYCAWVTEENLTLSLHRNLICAITLRSLMTLVIQTEIILPISENSKYNKNGIPALATFETLTLDLVLGFWTVQTIVLWKTITCAKFTRLRLNIYTYASFGLSLSFTLIWVIVMASTQDSSFGWIGVRSWPQWLNEPLRIIFLTLQIYLICVCGKKLFWDDKNPVAKMDPKKARHVRIETIYILLLTPIFILQFSLNAGTPTGSDCEEAYFYTFYFIDGLQGACVCLFFFYIDSEVKNRILASFGLSAKPTEPARSIKTLDSLRNRQTADDNNDIVYSSVLDPERHASVLQMYQKQNLIPTTSVTIVEGETFMACGDRKLSTNTLFFDAVSDVDVPVTPVTESKYSTLGESQWSSSSENGSVQLKKPVVARSVSMEAVRNSVPDDLYETKEPKIFVTIPTIDRSSFDEGYEIPTPVDETRTKPNVSGQQIVVPATPNMSTLSYFTNMQEQSKKLDVENSSSDEDEIIKQLRKTEFTADPNVFSRSSTESESTLPPEFRIRLNKELDNVLKTSQEPDPYVYNFQHENDDIESPNTLTDDSESSTSIDSFQMTTFKKCRKIESDAVSSDSDERQMGDFSDDDKIPEDIMDLLLSKEVEKVDQKNHQISKHDDDVNNTSFDETVELDHDHDVKNTTFDQIPERVNDHDANKTSLDEKVNHDHDPDVKIIAFDQVPEYVHDHDVNNTSLDEKVNHDHDPDVKITTSDQIPTHVHDHDENNKSFDETVGLDHDHDVKITTFDQIPERVHDHDVNNTSFDEKVNNDQDHDIKNTTSDQIPTHAHDHDVNNTTFDEKTSHSDDHDVKTTFDQLTTHDDDLKNTAFSKTPKRDDVSDSSDEKFSSKLKDILPSFKSKTNDSDSETSSDNADDNIPRDVMNLLSENISKDLKNASNLKSDVDNPRNSTKITADLTEQTESSENWPQVIKTPETNETDKNLSSSSSSSSSDDDETEKSSKDVKDVIDVKFNLEKPPSLTKVTAELKTNKTSKMKSSSSSSSSDDDNDKAIEYPTIKRTQPELPGLLRKWPEVKQVHTLPRTDEPVAKPRTLGVTEQRGQQFSKMFSKHRDKLLSSRLEGLDDNKKQLRKVVGVENLNSLDEDWQPQNVHFTDN